VLTLAAMGIRIALVPPVMSPRPREPRWRTRRLVRRCSCSASWPPTACGS